MSSSTVLSFSDAFEIGLTHICATCKEALLVSPAFDDYLRLAGFKIICPKCLGINLDWQLTEPTAIQSVRAGSTLESVSETYHHPLKFWRNVKIAFDSKGRIDYTPCWPWLKSVDKHGYGWKKVGNFSNRAHRYAYAVSHPQDPLMKGLVIRHQCDNPPCCNILHTVQGTYFDNSLDTLERNKLNRKLTIEKARLLILLTKLGRSTKELALLFSIKEWQVGAIQRGYCWRIINGRYDQPRSKVDLKSGRRGRKSRSEMQRQIE